VVLFRAHGILCPGVVLRPLDRRVGSPFTPLELVPAQASISLLHVVYLPVAVGSPEKYEFMAQRVCGPQIVVRLIRAQERSHWEYLMSIHHYLGFRSLTGESIRYVAEFQDTWLALLGWGSGSFKFGACDRWIGWTPEQQWQRLHLLACNQRFLILPDPRIPNLASRVLSLNVKRLSRDWEEFHGHPVVLQLPNGLRVSRRHFWNVSGVPGIWQIEYIYRVLLLHALRPMRDFDGSLFSSGRNIDVVALFALQWIEWH